MAYVCTHLSADAAIRFAMSEYLHTDCRLMHARQWGLVRSHCVESSLQPGCHVAMSPWCLRLHRMRTTYLGLALDALFAAQRGLVALLLLLGRLALGRRRDGRGRRAG